MDKSTRIIHKGRNPRKYSGNVNTPIFQTSTIVFDNLEELDKAKVAYGRHGTDTVFELANLVAEIENAHEVFFTSCGLSAITLSILSFVSAGDHLLVSDEAYDPTKSFVEKFLPKYGVEYSYYKTGDIESLKSAYKSNTKAIFTESPGSVFFHIDDFDELISFAKSKKLKTIIDNTWSAGRLFRPLDIGFDVSVQSCSKYFSGHSDVMLGSIAVLNQEDADIVSAQYKVLGTRVSPQDCYLVSRGIRTLDLRLDRQFESGIEIAKFLEQEKLVEKVFYPALESHESHDLWKKYFSGAHGLMSFYFKKEVSLEKIRSFVDSLKIFGIGYSWGGYESLIMLYSKAQGLDLRNCNDHIIRICAGTESVNDIKQDLANGFALLK